MRTTEITGLGEKILRWYARQKRDLPWRGTRNAYAVWVAEIMLQQTRVDTVRPYYERWMERFPTVADLAAASQREVLTLWEGLGYYSRARNLHRAAQIVVRDCGGRVPRDPAVLRELPGIGRYTAGAICSIAFGLDVPAVDGNVRRLLARIFDVQSPLGTPESEDRFWELAGLILPPGRAGDFNQALMDLGATVCLPRSPRCADCPVRSQCAAFALGIQGERPVRRRRPDLPHYLVTAAVIRQGERILITRRPQDSLLGGMWEFPGGKVEPGENFGEGLQREITEELGIEIKVGEACGVYKHAYTHFKVTVHAFYCDLADGLPRPLEVDDLYWATSSELSTYPMGKIDRMISHRILEAREID